MTGSWRVIKHRNQQDCDFRIRNQHPFRPHQREYIKWLAAFTASNPKPSYLNAILKNKEKNRWRQTALKCMRCVCVHVHLCLTKKVNEIMHSEDHRQRKPRRKIKYAQDSTYWIPLMEVRSVWTQRALVAKITSIRTQNPPVLNEFITK